MQNNTQTVRAPLWRRFAAMIYDSFILLAISMAYGATSLFFFASFFEIKANDYSPVMSGFFFQLGWLVSIAIFYVYFWRNAGQTVGMRAWKITIQNLDGHRPTYFECIVRYCVSLISLILLGLGYFYALVDPQKRTLHDILSRTQTLYIIGR